MGRAVRRVRLRSRSVLRASQKRDFHSESKRSTTPSAEKGKEKKNTDHASASSSLCLLGAITRSGTYVVEGTLNRTRDFAKWKDTWWSVRCFEAMLPCAGVRGGDERGRCPYVGWVGFEVRFGGEWWASGMK